MFYVLAFVILLLAELLYFRIADRYDIIDKPNMRSSHTVITLRGGGVIFYLGMLMYAAVSRFNYPWFLAGLTLVSVISFWDDIRSLPNKVRLLFQFTGMGLMFYQWGLLSGTPWWYLAIALVFCTGVVNVYNFLDGINGMLGVYNLGVLGVLGYLNYQYDFIDPQLLYIAAVSVLVFCIFNFRTKAKCFAGDVGAISLAFIMIFAIGLLILKTQSLYYVILLAVYGADSLLTIIKRLKLGENIFKAHRKHAYQIMANELGVPQLRVTTIYTLLQLIISTGAIYFSTLCPWIYFSMVVVVLLAAYLVIMAMLRRKQSN